METNELGLELIKSFESLQTKAYKLSGEKYYTIGWGHSFDSSITAKTVWTEKQADAQLKKDLAKFEKYVTQIAGKKFELNENQFSALVSYTYNRGAGGLKQLIRKTKTIENLPDNMVIYWGTAKKYQTGLVRRREKERSLFIKGTSLGIPTVINKNSRDKTIIWMQNKLNSVDTGLTKLETDGAYGAKTKAYVVAVWKKWGWKPSSGKAIGTKTIQKLKKL